MEQKHALALIETEIEVLREALELAQMLSTEPQLSSLRKQHENLTTVLRDHLDTLKLEIKQQAAG